MKTDSIFYELFLNLPESLFALLGLPVQLAQKYQFISQELKQLAKRIDGVFLPITADQPIYFVEVQFQEDENLYYRLFTEIFTYLGQYKPAQDFQAVVFWAKRNFDIPLPVYYQRFQQWEQLKIIYLDELNCDDEQSLGVELIKLIVASETEAKIQVKRLFSQVENTLDSLTKKKDIIELIEKILIYKFTNYSREELDRMFTLSDFKKTRFYQDTFAEGKAEGKLEGKLEGKAEGKLEGKLEGKAEGKLEGKLEVVSDLVKLGLTVEQIATALKLDVELVKKVAQTR